MNQAGSAHYLERLQVVAAYSQQVVASIAWFAGPPVPSRFVLPTVPSRAQSESPYDEATVEQFAVRHFYFEASRHRAKHNCSVFVVPSY